MGKSERIEREERVARCCVVRANGWKVYANKDENVWLKKWENRKRKIEREREYLNKHGFDFVHNDVAVDDNAAGTGVKFIFNFYRNG